MLESTEGERVEQQPANSDGRFAFDNLRKTNYRLTVTAEGFQTSQQEVNLSVGANRYFVHVLLTPSGGTHQSNRPATAPTLTDEQAPKTARKEYEKGARALEARHLSEAQAHLEKAVREYPCYARAQTQLGLVLSQQQKFPRSEAALRKAVQCDPTLPEAYTLLGQLLSAQKRFRESETVLEQGERYSPAAWQFHYQVAIACYGRQDLAKAETEYLRAQSLNPEMPPEFHVRLADLYTKKGSYAKAYGEMQTYLRAEPNGRFAPGIKSIMQQMESTGVLNPQQADR